MSIVWFWVIWGDVSVGVLVMKDNGIKEYFCKVWIRIYGFLYNFKKYIGGWNVNGWWYLLNDDFSILVK